MDSGQNPVVPRAMGPILSVGEKAIYVDLDNSANWKIGEPACYFSGRSSMKILYLSPLCQTLSKAFSTSRKAATTCSPLLKLSITDWESLKR